MAKKKRKKTRRPYQPPTRAATAATGTKPEAADPSTREEEVEAVERLAEERDKPLAGPRPSGRKDAATAPVSHRQARKEAARRERERRLKAVRRRARMRRAVRWGVVLGVAAAIGAFVWYRVTADRRLEAAATVAARALGCGQVLEPGQGIQDLGRSHSPPFVEGTGGLPATSGSHSNTIEPPPQVFDQPIPEANAVHNLEHGYVIVYYQAKGEDALPDDVRAELESLVDGEGEVLMAPYSTLKEGQSLALASWTRLQTCGVPDDASPEDAATLTRSFIANFRNTIAPEAGA